MSVLLPRAENGQEPLPFYLAILSATTSVLSGYYYIGGFFSLGSGDQSLHTPTTMDAEAGTGK